MAVAGQHFYTVLSITSLGVSIHPFLLVRINIRTVMTGLHEYCIILKRLYLLLYYLCTDINYGFQLLCRVCLVHIIRYSATVLRKRTHFLIFPLFWSNSRILIRRWCYHVSIHSEHRSFASSVSYHPAKSKIIISEQITKQTDLDSIFNVHHHLYLDLY
jgi:hypothetical protein